MFIQVPYIYSYLLDRSKGLDPKPITENELNELRNLKKKVEYLKDKLQEGQNLDEDEDHNSESEEDDDDVADFQPKKKNVKA